MKIFKSGFINNLLTAFGILLILLFSAFVIIQQGEKSISLYMIIYAAAFILYFISLLIVKKFSSKNDSNNKYNKTLVIIFLFGVLFRITLIPSSPSTSDDVYRYIWEGKILANGYNPFELAPDNKKLEYLHTEKYPDLVTYKNMTTIYPAAAQLVFTAGYLLTGENDIGLKIIYLLAEIITFVFIVKILRLRGLNQNLLIAYAWLPLPIMEYFVNSHIDVVGISFFMMFLYFILKGKTILPAVLMGLSILTKLYLAIVIPLLIKKMGLKKFLNFTIILFIILILGIVPFIPSERSVNSSLFTYLSTWNFNGSVYSFFNLLFEDGYLARSISLVLFVVFVGNIAVKYKDFLAAVYWVWIAFIMFAATLYPWYLGWIAAVNPFFIFGSVISLFFTINVSNITPLGDVWKEYWWVYLIEYLPFYFLLGIEVLNILKFKKIGSIRKIK